MPDRDEHYIKYRVFHEPSDEDVPDIERIGHPVPFEASFMSKDSYGIEEWTEAQEVEGFFFVLRPESDHHARVAIASYAYSCRVEFPHLAADLIKMVEEIEWEEQTGQYDAEYVVEGEHPSDNVVDILKTYKGGK